MNVTTIDLQILDVQVEVEKWIPSGGPYEEMFASVWFIEGKTQVNTLQRYAYASTKYTYRITFKVKSLVHKAVIAATTVANRPTKYTLLTHVWESEKTYDAQSLKVLTYNIWNYNNDWTARKQLIADLVKNTTKF